MSSLLWASIEREEFFQLEYAQALGIVGAAFTPELERLRHATKAAESPGDGPSGSSADRPSNPSPSRLLFGHEYDEINRTITGILALRWILTNDYTSFVGCQDPPDRLSPVSFVKLKELFHKHLASPADIFALITAVVVNDLGKDERISEEVTKITRQSIQGRNHDVALYEAVNAGLIPCVKALDDEQKDVLLRGLKMGAQLNLGQLAQAENVPGSLEIIGAMRGHEHAFDLKFLEQMIDVAGAAGHADWSCAKRMTEPVFQSFMIAYKVLISIMQGHRTLRQGYDDLLQDKSVVLHASGFRALSVEDPQDRALLRLMAMSRTTNKEQAGWVESAFKELDPATALKLVGGLNVDGYHDGKAILPYYMPALLVAALKNTRDSTPSAKANALSSLLRFLTKILDETYPSPGSPGEIVERDLLFAKDTITSDSFKHDPSVLDHIPISMVY